MISLLSEALAERGFDTLTPVQEAVTEPDLTDADLLVSAQTGSGKTVGFGLAIAPTLLREDDRFGPAATPLALVVAPTRELAFQVMQELRWLYARTGAVVSSCVGGMDIRAERRALERGAHIVVGTPGRLCDHVRRGALDLGDIRAVVLDEADEMLDLGFREDLEFLLGAAPEDRRTLLFSATVSPMIAKLAEQFQRDARRISTINKSEQHSDISYKALRVAAADANHAIFNLLRYHDDQSAIVFANTRATVNQLSARLSNRGLAVVTLSGELSQSERSHALQAMRDGRARVCVATDVAARGIDLPNLNLVIHADLPTNTESLLHRSGRTGRAGRKGISVLIVPPRTVKQAERLLKWAKVTAEWTVPPSAEDIIQRDEERLLNDQSWSEPVTEEQAEVAARLLARHGAEAVAAALYRMHQSRHAAPEELSPPDMPAAREHKDFGPSRWFALSVGRNDRAEPRWLLPLLRRSADLEKAAIGAIRVQESETFVEIAEASVGQLMAALGPDGEIQDGIRVRPLDGLPEFSRPARAPRPEGAKPWRTRDEGEAPRPWKAKPGSPKPNSPKPGSPKPGAGAAGRSERPDAGKYERKPRRDQSSSPGWSAADAPSEQTYSQDAPGARKPKYQPKEGKKPGAKPAPKHKSAPKPDSKWASKGGPRKQGKPSAPRAAGQGTPHRRKT
ncbi:DEAD/DEAH box helicase [Defluviimonas sp. WL0002]|uniref:DEAD/DEAH box helicase n=1 Tax=Albidovulum marisflavi TaxID=2984159 RepID=A0ABT2ZGK3_9RHOB|nr:DEAD/DEAH box helicase [Defluviimonas sp. WL0002]MCV2870270.1 DEAD/DEAH box helicase [Defluviimonas sp. WL0002]